MRNGGSLGRGLPNGAEKTSKAHPAGLIEDRKARLAFKASSQGRVRQLKDICREKLWPQIRCARGKKVTKRQREAILASDAAGTQSKDGNGFVCADFHSA